MRNFLLFLAAIAASTFFGPVARAAEWGIRHAAAIEDECAARRYFAGGVSEHEGTPNILRPDLLGGQYVTGTGWVYPAQHYATHEVCRVEAYGFGRATWRGVPVELGAGRNSVGRGSAYGLALLPLVRGERWTVELGAGLTYDQGEQWRGLTRLAARRALGRGWTLAVDVEPAGHGGRSSAVGLSIAREVQP